MSQTHKLHSRFLRRMFWYKNKLRFCFTHFRAWHNFQSCSFHYTANPFEWTYLFSTGIALFTPLIRVSPTTKVTYRIVTLLMLFLRLHWKHFGSPKFRYKHFRLPATTLDPAQPIYTHLSAYIGSDFQQMKTLVLLEYGLFRGSTSSRFRIAAGILPAP